LRKNLTIGRSLAWSPWSISNQPLAPNSSLEAGATLESQRPGFIVLRRHGMCKTTLFDQRGFARPMCTREGLSSPCSGGKPMRRSLFIAAGTVVLGTASILAAQAVDPDVVGPARRAAAAAGNAVGAPGVERRIERREERRDNLRGVEGNANA